MPSSKRATGPIDVLPPRRNSLRANLPAPNLHRVPNAWHFGFMDTTSMSVAGLDGDVVADPPGFDRDAFMKQLAVEITACFDKTLFQPVQSSDVRHLPAHPVKAPSLIMRSDFLDRMRAMPTMLVVFHHTAIMFGGDGGWYLQRPADFTLAAILLTLLCAVDQSFFMGAFFLLAGYFTPRSYLSKGPSRVAKDRLARLGLSLLVYGFLIRPLTLALAETPNPADALAAWGVWVHRGTFNMGLLWFAWALLIFAAAYMALQALSSLPSHAPGMADSALSSAAASFRHGRIAFVSMAWGGGVFLLRFWVPKGHERWRLQIGFFAPYILLLALGCAAAPQRRLEWIDGKTAASWGGVSLLTLPTLCIYALASGAFRGQPFELHGGRTLPVLAYAFWEAFVGC